MRTINRVVIMGHLAADPELRQTKSGIVVTQFPVATNHFTRDEKGEKSEVADFHRIVAFKGLADICNKYLAKGMPVYVEGRLVNNFYDDKNGTRHYKTEILADNLNILTWRKTKGGEGEVGVKEIPEVSEKEEAEELAVA